MSQTVLMEVACIGPECKSCPELDLEVGQYHVYSEDQHSEWVNAVFCKHCSACERIQEHLRKNSNSDNEKDGV